LIQQSLSQIKIEIMLTQYHSNRFRLKTSSWNLHVDSRSMNRSQSTCRSSSAEYFEDRSQSAYRSSLSSIYVSDRSQSITRSSIVSMTTSDRSSLSSINRDNEIIKSSISSLRSSSFASTSQKSRLFQFTSKNLSNRSEFKNSWINDTKKWSYSQNRLCVRCDYINHISKKCTNDSCHHESKVISRRSCLINQLRSIIYQRMIIKNRDRMIISWNKILSSCFDSHSIRKCLMLFKLQIHHRVSCSI
jgi:hypothetical protein